MQTLDLPRMSCGAVVAGMRSGELLQQSKALDEATRYGPTHHACPPMSPPLFSKVFVFIRFLGVAIVYGSQFIWAARGTLMLGIVF